jgi:tol-pal system protein YbgF
MSPSPNRPRPCSPSSITSVSSGTCGLLFILGLLALSTGCVLDRTGQSRTLGLQQDLAQTHTQVQALQRQFDDQLNRTSARLVEVEENAQLNRRNMADSGALLDTMISEMQALRGTFEEINQRVAQGDSRAEKFQEDIDFRFQEFEKRLAALEKAQTALASATLPASSGSGDVPVDAQEQGDKLSPDDTLKRAKGYYDAGNYKVALAFLKGFKKRFPTSPAREEAQFLLAESLFKDGDPRGAVQEYQALVDDFPKSARVPTVMLRQGEAFVALGEKEDARVFFNELIRAFPRSAEAESARAHLKELKP